jgi:hypothetical protein
MSRWLQPHATSQKTAFITVTAVKTSNRTIVEIFLSPHVSVHDMRREIVTSTRMQEDHDLGLSPDDSYG